MGGVDAKIQQLQNMVMHLIIFKGNILPVVTPWTKGQGQKVEIFFLKAYL